MRYYLLRLLLWCAWVPVTAQTRLDSLPPSRSALLSEAAVKLFRSNRFDSALVLTNRALTLARYEGDSLQIAICLNNTGLLYSKKGDPAKSNFYYEQSLALLRELHNYEKLPTALLNMGIAYKEQGIYDKAVKYLFEAAAFFERRKDLKQLSSAYNTLGNIFRKEKSYAKALVYHEKSLKLRQEIAYKEGIAASLNNIGVVYKEMSRPDSALMYFRQSLQLIRDKEKTEDFANTLSHIAEIYVGQQKYTAAEKYYDSAYSIRKAAGSKKGMVHSYYEQASLQFVRNDFSQAESYLLPGIELAREVGASDILLKCYNLLRKVYRAKKNYVQALAYDEAYILLNEQVMGEDRQKSLAQMEVKYETEKKQEEIVQLNQEKEKREAVLLAQELQLEVRKAHNRNLLLVTLLLGCIVVLLALLFRGKHRFARHQEMLRRELHHRVSNDFQVLLSVFRLQQDTIQDRDAREVITGNGQRIMALMLVHSVLYSEKNTNRRIHMDTYLRQVTGNLLLAYKMQDRNVRLIYSIDAALTLEADAAISMGLLVNELITNAFKYAFGNSNSSPELEISFGISGGKHRLLIRDNGPGKGVATSKLSFGMKIVDSQVKRLKGSLHTYTDNGLAHEIIFP